MQIILKDKDKGNISRRTNSMDLVIYIRRISKCLEREFVERFEIKRSRIQINRRIFVKVKKEFSKGDEKSVKVAELGRMK